MLVSLHASLQRQLDLWTVGQLFLSPRAEHADVPSQLLWPHRSDINDDVSTGYVINNPHQLGWENHSLRWLPQSFVWCLGWDGWRLAQLQLSAGAVYLWAFHDSSLKTQRKVFLVNKVKAAWPFMTYLQKSHHISSTINYYWSKQLPTCLDSRRGDLDPTSPWEMCQRNVAMF